MNILITGNKGFIASGLEGDGIDIKDGFDIVTYKAFQKYDVVIHTAALTSVTESLRKPEDYVRTNILGTLNMLLQHPEARFIYLSTASVYGEGENHTVDSPLKPASIYASTKLAGEFLVRNLAKSYCILRLTNVIGPGIKGEPNVYQVFEKEEILPVYGDGMQTRDFIRVEEVRRIINRVVEYESLCGIFNVGSGKTKNIIQVAREFNKLVRFLPERPGEVKYFGVKDALNYSS